MNERLKCNPCNSKTSRRKQDIGFGNDFMTVTKNMQQKQNLINGMKNLYTMKETKSYCEMYIVHLIKDLIKNNF